MSAPDTMPPRTTVKIWPHTRQYAVTFREAQDAYLAITDPPAPGAPEVEHTEWQRKIGAARRRYENAMEIFAVSAAGAILDDSE